MILTAGLVDHVPDTIPDCDKLLTGLRRRLRLAAWGHEGGVSDEQVELIWFCIDDVLDRRLELAG